MQIACRIHARTRARANPLRKGRRKKGEKRARIASKVFGRGQFFTLVLRNDRSTGAVQSNRNICMGFVILFGGKGYILRGRMIMFRNMNSNVFRGKCILAIFQMSLYY